MTNYKTNNFDFKKNNLPNMGLIVDRTFLNIS